MNNRGRQCLQLLGIRLGEVYDDEELKSNTVEHKNEEDDNDRTIQNELQNTTVRDSSPDSLRKSGNASKTIIEENSFSNNCIIKKVTRKRFRDEATWKCNKSKKLSAGGLPHISKRGKHVPGKAMKPPCKCKLKCFEKLPYESSKEIHQYYWDSEKSIDVKRQFIAARVKVMPVKRKRPTNGTKSRQITHKYYFIVNSNEVFVGKQMFLSTLCISQNVVSNALRKQQTGGLVSPNQRGHHEPPNKIPTDVIDGVKKHISSFPTYQSHYSREKTQKTYLGSHLSIQSMYKLYQQKCTDENQQPCKEWLYRHIFNTEFNFGFHFPSIDTCDKYSVQLKNAETEENKTLVQLKYDEHLKESEERYHLKKADKTRAKEDLSYVVLTGDLHKCLPTPFLINSHSFYYRKLWTYNFTLLNTANNISHCFMWDETKGARGANEIASCILKWAELHMNNNAKELTIWSDNCPGQTRNIIVAMAYSYILNKYKNLEKINHKFLLSGHTHMEVDGVHGVIERKKKSTPSMVILTPAGWQQLISSINENINVVNMEISDFLNFKDIFTSIVLTLFQEKKIPYMMISLYLRLYIYNSGKRRKTLVFTKLHFKNIHLKKYFYVEIAEGVLELCRRS